MTMDNNHTDSPSTTNQYQDKVLQAFFESLSKTLELILHSPEAMEATLSTFVGRRNFVIENLHMFFQEVEENFQSDSTELKEFRGIQKEFLRVWKSMSKS